MSATVATDVWLRCVIGRTFLSSFPELRSGMLQSGMGAFRERRDGSFGFGELIGSLRSALMIAVYS